MNLKRKIRSLLNRVAKVPESGSPDRQRRQERQAEKRAQRADEIASEMLWNQAAVLDSLAVLGESFRLESELNQERLKILSQGLRSLDSRIETGVTRIEDGVDRLEEIKVGVDEGDTSPKKFDFALTAHLIAWLGRKAGTSPVCVDVGAHRGCVSKLAAEAGATVFAIEPNPELTSILEERFDACDRVSVIKKAISDSEGEANLHIATASNPGDTSEDLSLFSTLAPHPLFASLAFTEEVAVQQTTLRKLVESEEIPEPVSFLKIDTEGLEMAVVDGMGELRPDVVSLEYWSEGIGFRSAEQPKPSEHVARLEKKGYPFTLTVYQTVGAVLPKWERGFSEVPLSYGNQFFFREEEDFQVAVEWCELLLSSNGAQAQSSVAKTAERVSSSADLHSDDDPILHRLQSLGFLPSSILDVGASDGSWTVECSKVFPAARYFLIEPLARLNSEYARVLNWVKGLDFDSRVIVAACGASDGEGNFYIDTASEIPVGSSAVLESEVPGFERTSVPFRAIDSLLENGEIDPPDLIKMDVQAGEREALRGAEQALKTCTVIFVETWISRGYGIRTPLLLELAEELSQRGFSIFDFGHPHRMGNAGVLIAQDVAFVRRDSDLGRLLNSEYHSRDPIS